MDARTRTEVHALVRAALPPAAHPDDVTDDATLDAEGLGLDSVGLVDLLGRCEERFGIDLPPDVLLGDGAVRLTVGDLVREVAGRLGPPS